MSKWQSLVGQRFGQLTVIMKTDGRDGGHVIYQCRCDCGEVAPVASHNLRNGHTNSCGCLRKRRGPASPQWKSGLPETVRAKRHASAQYREWRTKVMARCHNTCACCKEEALVTHHINAWATHPQDRYDVRNGTALCANCHSKLHHECGNKTTRPTFIAFLLQHGKDC